MAEKGNFEGSGKGKKAKVEVPDILEKGGEPAAAGAAENGEEKHALENGVSVYLLWRTVGDTCFCHTSPLFIVLLTVNF